MKVTMLAVGSRGDVQPYVALGKGLRAAGYDVLLATHEDFEEFVRGHGLGFLNLGGNTRQMMETEVGREIAASGANPWPFMLRFRQIFTQSAGELLERSLEACAGAGAIIYSIFALPGYHIAEKIGIPAFPALLQPMSRTRYLGLQPLPAGMRSRLYNWLTIVGAQQMFGQLFAGIMTRWRTQRLGLPRLPRGGLYSLIDRRRVPVLYGYSPTVVPRPPDWGPWLHVTGFWFLDQASGWQPPADLLEFIEGGEPPVYVGFGSMSSRDPEATAELVMAALRKAGRRGVLLSGWGGMRAPEIRDDVCLLDAAPHDWLFPRMAAVIHHGGAGTTGAGVRSGRPSFAVPFFGDQYFWADRLSRIGVGPGYIPRDRLSVDNLAAAIERAVEDETMGRRAAAAGRRVRAEDGVARAVAAFEFELKRRGAA